MSQNKYKKKQMVKKESDTAAIPLPAGVSQDYPPVPRDASDKEATAFDTPQKLNKQIEENSAMAPSEQTLIKKSSDTAVEETYNMPETPSDKTSAIDSPALSSPVEKENRVEELYTDAFENVAKVLEIKNLHTYFHTDEGVVKSVNDVSYFVRMGETLGVVGESGCGKSVTAKSILRLIPSPPGKIEKGQILFHGKDLTKISYEELRTIRGNKIAMIFQEPMTSLNPVYTVGEQIIESIEQHLDKTYDEARQMAIKILGKVGIPSPEKRIDVYPHQMSGGMKQRVMIAMALVCNPELLIADEPTTALDVTIQAQILELLQALQKEFNTAIILITHDLGVIAEMAHRVVVMYASKIVESAEVKELFANPKHPYTVGLFNSIPKIGKEDERLVPIRGMVPNPLDFPKGCKFNNRCDHVMPKCKEKEPQLKEVRPGHWAACWLNEGER